MRISKSLTEKFLGSLITFTGDQCDEAFDNVIRLSRCILIQEVQSSLIIRDAGFNNGFKGPYEGRVVEEITIEHWRFLYRKRTSLLLFSIKEAKLSLLSSELDHLLKDDLT